MDWNIQTNKIDSKKKFLLNIFMKIYQDLFLLDKIYGKPSTYYQYVITYAPQQPSGE
jgi:hypothetical protein